MVRRIGLLILEEMLFMYGLELFGGRGARGMVLEEASSYFP